MSDRHTTACCLRTMFEYTDETVRKLYCLLSEIRDRVEDPVFSRAFRATGAIEIAAESLRVLAIVEERNHPDDRCSTPNKPETPTAGGN